jgi:hypothetical protein
MKLHALTYALFVASCMVMSVNAAQPNNGGQQPNPHQQPFLTVILNGNFAVVRRVPALIPSGNTFEIGQTLVTLSGEPLNVLGIVMLPRDHGANNDNREQQ